MSQSAFCSFHFDKNHGRLGNRATIRISRDQ